MRAADEPKTPARSGATLKGEFYRQCRLWHGYLSAFAFLALAFFAFTGLLLNNPTWLATALPAEPTISTVVLPAPVLVQAKASQDPTRVLAEALGARAKLRGLYESGQVQDGQAIVRLEGATGATDLTIDMATGAAEIAVTRGDAVFTLNELHRGKGAGPVWKLVIDVAAIVILALSIVGYLLFFSLRFRLRTSLVLTAASLAAMVGLFAAFVP
jgi:hypothetical protein